MTEFQKSKDSPKEGEDTLEESVSLGDTLEENDTLGEVSSEEEDTLEYCGDDILFKSFDALKQMIIDGKFSDEIKQDMYETINTYINNDWKIDKDMITYLFTGWMIHTHLNNNKE